MLRAQLPKAGQLGVAPQQTAPQSDRGALGCPQAQSTAFGGRQGLPLQWGRGELDFGGEQMAILGCTGSMDLFPVVQPGQG